ncbi:hypothetical protein ASPZODRAFT_28158 [Penicilliopsis zonata CBS 506.65]|uniref:Uncharacterized protein n=1 Tax=Penicilliopsis zonata CBS 506.65 TaxID=1073090 RepID=A0A1L9S9Q1_9EURO|nr:hypothetical protein ASPZODRAFT_28158 [Penicilliopsis zonata CBS 506.65]OJJ43901.1 hypothetical protein ASPZODRAFT_28158 [Penicilliopsis zonata CBS 506.65]
MSFDFIDLNDIGMDYQDQGPQTFVGRVCHAASSMFYGTKALAYTLWLYTFDCFYTFILPVTFFALVGALTGRPFTSSRVESVQIVLQHVPGMFMWVWLNALLFNVYSQRTDFGIIRDRCDKPWRPLVSWRVKTRADSNDLYIALIHLCCALGWYLETLTTTILVMCQGWLFIRLRLGEWNWIFRSLSKTLVMLGYTAVATQIAAGGSPLGPSGTSWMVDFGLVLFSTISILDLPDQHGDAVTGRRTLPLVLGQIWGGFILTIPLGFWAFFFPSLVAPRFSDVFIPQAVVALPIIWKLWTADHFLEHKTTAYLWAVWICMYYPTYFGFYYLH